MLEWLFATNNCPGTKWEWRKIGPSEYVKNVSELCEGFAIPAVEVMTVGPRRVVQFRFHRSEKSSKTNGKWDSASHTFKGIL